MSYIKTMTMIIFVVCMLLSLYLNSLILQKHVETTTFVETVSASSVSASSESKPRQPYGGNNIPVKKLRSALATNLNEPVLSKDPSAHITTAPAAPAASTVTFPMLPPFYPSLHSNYSHLLPLAVIGFPKTGTSTMLRWLPMHPELSFTEREDCPSIYFAECAHNPKKAKSCNSITLDNNVNLLSAWEEGDEKVR